MIELFTSQGCNSCPPADKLLGKLAPNPNLIPLTLSVDYWDYLGWKDTLALHAHTKRQRNYARVRGDMNVYTPQAIVNGVKYAVGSDAARDQRGAPQSPEQRAGNSAAVKRDGENISVMSARARARRQSGCSRVTNKVEVQIATRRKQGRDDHLHQRGALLAQSRRLYAAAPIKNLDSGRGIAEGRRRRGCRLRAERRGECAGRDPQRRNARAALRREHSPQKKKKAAPLRAAF